MMTNQNSTTNASLNTMPVRLNYSESKALVILLDRLFSNGLIVGEEAESVGGLRRRINDIKEAYESNGEN